MIDINAHTDRIQRTQLANWFIEAMQAMQPGTRFQEDILLNGEELTLNDGRCISLDKYRKIWLFGAGKGAFSLATGIISKMGSKITGGAVIGPSDGSGKPLSVSPDSRVQFLPGNHPLPLQHSVESTQNLLTMAENVRPDDLVLFVLTGGASAMLCKPVPTVSLAYKQQRFKELLASGASIQEINAARKALSMVKGGGLLKAFSGAEVVNFIVSDVPGDDLYTIGSAPTQPTADQPYRGNVINCLLATPTQTARLVGRYARLDGYNVHVQDHAYSGDVAAVAGNMYSDIVRISESEASPSPTTSGTVLIYYGESEVVVQGNGKGGRNQHLALHLAIDLERLGRKVTVLSAGTDGIDGNTDAAGALCTESTARIARKKGLNSLDFLQNFDSHSFFMEIGDIFKIGPTGTNFADLQIVIVH
ncbi:MAG: DUF4147 domain-containing protein [Bacteroidetes bacterium]|nr:DUF4147 domain-containing protein [Bacteroidota bacterium]